MNVLFEERIDPICEKPVPHAAAGNSARVESSQDDIHPRLLAAVRRHLSAAWRQPLHPPSVTAVEAVEGLLSKGERSRLVLDSGCGTGSSTIALAQHHPLSVVIGIDRSSHRLSKWCGSSLPARWGNMILVRAELETFWRLAVAAAWRLERHYLLYPNPWPKPAHLQRRWHAHPVFPWLLALGGELELRCNWDIYAREFAAATELATAAAATLRPVEPQAPLSEFEAKYLASGHELFSVNADLRNHAASKGSDIRNRCS